MENSYRKNIIIIRILVIFLFLILLFLIYLSLRNIYNNASFYINGESKMNLQLNSEYVEPGFVAVLNGKNINDKVKIESNVDTKKLGNYEISYIYEIKFLMIKKVLKRHIIVKDIISPELVINSDDELYVYLNEEFNIPMFKAVDNVDGDITDKVKVNSNVDVNNVGKYNIIYSVKDSSNNETIKKIDVIVDKKIRLSYIKVDINAQKLYYYEKNKLVLETDIVTGMKGVSSTPTGNYKVLNKARNVTLKGADYTSFVSYWIAFKGNAYGLHDASWRSRFGGNIYTYYGSHGCVNMPINVVSKLYYMVEIGTPVYIN